MPARDVVNQAIRICMAFEPPFSLDLIVRTPKQLERGLRDDDWFLREVMEKGKMLYEAQKGVPLDLGNRRRAAGVSRLV